MADLTSDLNWNEKVKSEFLSQMSWKAILFGWKFPLKVNVWMKVLLVTDSYCTFDPSKQGDDEL